MAKKQVVETEEIGKFVLKMENPRNLKAIIETLSNIIDECEFEINIDELIVSAMDPSRVCLLQLKISNQHFDEYRSNKPIKVCLNLDDFNKIMKRSSTKDTIELSYNENEQKIKIKMKKEGVSRTRTFSLSLLDLNSEEVPMQGLLEIDYDVEWQMDPDFLIEALKDAEIYSEVLNMKACEEEGIIFSSIGQIGEMTYELGLDELKEPNISDENTGAYSILFLKSISKISSITEKLEISLKTDHPLKMTFDLLEGGELNFFLAPRVDEGDQLEEDDNLEV